MKIGKAILLGCGILSLALIALVLGGGAVVYYLAQDPENVAVYLESPETVKQGEPFDLRVIVVNERKHKPLIVASIDLSENYLEGVAVRGCEPASRSSSHVSLAGGQSYTFDKTIPAGGTNTFTFHLRAKSPGTFSGDVDVYEGMRLLSAVVETEVVE